eukprot:1876325-Alexandrium_andersonii.AAC.1
MWSAAGKLSADPSPRSSGWSSWGAQRSSNKACVEPVRRAARTSCGACGAPTWSAARSPRWSSGEPLRSARGRQPR